MKTSSAKNKGRRLQNEVVSKIRDTFNLEEDDVTSRSMGSNGEDILLSPKARELFPYSVECKNTETLNIWSALQQAEYNSKGYTPLVIFKRNRSEIFISMKLEDFLKIKK